MASRIWREVQTAKRGRKIISGSFAPAGAGAPTSVKGAGVDRVVRNGAGNFSVFFKNPFVQFESITISLQLAAATDRFVVLNSLNPATPTQAAFTFGVVDGAGAAQDIAADANNRINFTAVLRNN